MLDREAIAGLIPHAGDMCLLDRALGWDDFSIRCRSDSHRRSDHPLRRDGRLGAVHLVEYAAQATAIHHALLAPRPECAPMPGYLAAVRHVRLEVNWLDEIVASERTRADALIARFNGEWGGSIEPVFTEAAY